MNTSLVATLCGAALLAGCASTPKLNYADYAGEPIRSFYMPSYQGWAPANKNQVVVWADFNKAYLVTVNGYCPDLRFANVIGITSTGGKVDKFEKVVVGHDRCFIKEIRPIDTQQMKEDRKVLAEQMRKPAT